MPQAPRPIARPRHTRIVATIGPASRSVEQLRAILVAGVDVCRVNCSHSTAEGIRADVARIRRAASAEGLTVGILLDLQGPKIRTGTVPTPVKLEPGDLLTVHMDEDFVPEPGQTQVGTTWPAMSSDVKPGEPVLFADGLISGTVETVTPQAVGIRIHDRGELGSHKGINLPKTRINAPSLTEKDRADLIVGAAAGVDFVALSFVRTAEDVLDLRRALEAAGAGDIPIIAKIEKPQAVENIDQILEAAQGIMVARGDLGVEIPYERVPIVQKALIAAANEAGRLVITATQMLDSMERNPRPTRAEITDVANAILDGTDAVMLSGETATGRYPAGAVQVMDRIARQAEQSVWLKPPDILKLPSESTAEATVLQAACFAVRSAPRPLVVFTWSGSTAIKASKSRPMAGIFAITHSRRVCDRLSMAWGVTPLLIPVIEGTDNLIAAGEKALIESGLLDRGQEVVLLAGRAPMRGATNMMKVEILDGRVT